MRRFCYFVLVSVLGLLSTAQVLGAPVIQHWQTENGLRVYFVPAPEIPMIDIRLVFDAGSSRDQRFPGLASLTAGLLDEGSGDWDADLIANRFEDVGAEYSASVLRDMAWTSLRSLSAAEYFEPALETFIKVVTSTSSTKFGITTRRENQSMLFIYTVYPSCRYTLDAYIER